MSDELNCTQTTISRYFTTATLQIWLIYSNSSNLLHLHKHTKRILSHLVYTFNVFNNKKNLGI